MRANENAPDQTRGTHDTTVNCGMSQPVCPMESVEMTCLSNDLSYIAWRLPDGSYVLFHEDDLEETTQGVFTAALMDAPHTSSGDTKLSILEFPALPEFNGTNVQISIADGSLNDLEIVATCTIAVKGT